MLVVAVLVIVEGGHPGDTDLHPSVPLASSGDSFRAVDFGGRCVQRGAWDDFGVPGVATTSCGASTTPNPPANPTATTTAAPTARPTATPTTASPAAVAPVTFVTIGDSITAGYLNPGPAWPAAVDSASPGARLVYNAGVTGNTTAMMLRRMPKVYAQRAKLLFILGGVNDLAACISVATAVSNVRRMIAGAQAHGMTVVVLLMAHVSVKHSNSARKCGSKINSQINSLDAALVSMAVLKGVGVVDLRVALDTRGAYTRAYSLDGLHPNQKGVARIRDAVLAYARNHGCWR